MIGKFGNRRQNGALNSILEGSDVCEIETTTLQNVNDLRKELVRLSRNLATLKSISETVTVDGTTILALA